MLFGKFRAASMAPFKHYCFLVEIEVESEIYVVAVGSVYGEGLVN